MIKREKKKTFIDYFFIGFSFLASKKIVAILEITLFIMLLDISTGQKEVLKKQEQDMITEQQETNVKTYNKEIVSITTDTAIKELIKCYQDSIEESELTSKIKENIDSLKELFTENPLHFSFLYQDLYSGFTVSYNEDAPIFTASSIKAPAMIYLYEKASQNEVDLNEELIYTNNFYHGGSGILQNKPQNTSYKVGELIKYAIEESDNIAYAMLMNRYERKNILNFWTALGTKSIFTLDTIWGVTSAKDASIYMGELYRFYQTNETYGKTLMEYFKGAKWKLLSDKNGNFNTANKGGWSGTAIHDIAIVFDKNPYLLIVMSNTGESNYFYLFQNTSKIVGKLHEAYWQYKEDKCSKIKQY